MTKVMVVDDSEIELERIKEATTHASMDCIFVSDPLRALGAAIAFKPDFIMLDLNMPGMSGRELCELLKTTPETVAIPIIFYSATINKEIMQDGMHIGVIDFIEKPITPKQLIKIINSHDLIKQTRAVFAPIKSRAIELKEKYSKPYAPDILTK